ncbi:MAG: putative signal peptidase, partial [Methanobacteriaceae archaeon 41_258]
MKDHLELVTYIVILLAALILSQHMNVVVSGSMEPVFYRGDIVIVEKSDFFGLQEFNPLDVKKGDIIIYNANWFPEPVIHRIIDIKEDE